MSLSETTKREIDSLCTKIITAAIEVHKELGSNQSDSLHAGCFKQELKLKGLRLESEFTVPVRYKRELVDARLRIDFLVEGKVVVIIKTDPLTPAHTTQILEYMRLLTAPKGIIINFNCSNLFHEGQRTVANNLYHQLL